MISDKLNKLNLPKLSKTGDKEPLYLVRITFGSFEWFISEYNHDEKMAYGFANLNDPDMAELGYIDIEELENVKATHNIFIVEIDRSYIPIKLDQIRANLYR